MTTTKKFVKMTTVLALVLVSALCLGTFRADAHYLSIIPKTSTVEVGSEHTAMLSFTHAFLESQYNSAAIGQEPSIFSAQFLYNDGTKTTFPSFVEFDDPNGVEIKSPDAVIARAKLEKPGTTFLTAECDIVMGYEELQFGYVGYTKQILNAKNDGFSSKATGWKKGIEIVPVNDISGLKVQEAASFKVLYKGAPLANAKVEWADEKSPIFMGEEGRESLRELGKTNEDGVIRYTPTNKGLQFLGVMHEVSPDVKTHFTDWYSSCLIFNANEKTDGPTTSPDEGGSGSGGGCNAGAALPLLAVLPLLAFALRRR